MRSMTIPGAADPTERRKVLNPAALAENVSAPPENIHGAADIQERIRPPGLVSSEAASYSAENLRGAADMTGRRKQ